MTQIGLTFALSILGLVLLFFFLWKVRDSGAQNQAVVSESLPPVAGLSAVSIPNLDVLLGSDDYGRLRSRPELRAISKKFLQDRRRIALMWLDGLQTDIRTLWEFRRFLVRNGLRVTLKEELAVASAALAALIYLEVARVAVFVVGPFALRGALRNAKSLLYLLSRRSVVPLSRATAASRAEIEKRWAQHLLLQRAG